MQRGVLEVKRARFSLKDNRHYILQGTWPKGWVPEAILDGECLEVRMEAWENNSALERFQNLERCQGEWITLNVSIPDNLAGKRELSIYAIGSEKKIRWFCIKVRELDEQRRKPQYYIEQLQRNPQERTCSITGWVVSDQPVKINVQDLCGETVPSRISRMQRVDVQAIFRECIVGDECGFALEMNHLPKKDVRISFMAGGEENGQIVSMRKWKIWKDAVREAVRKTVRYVKMQGLWALPGKLIEKLTGKNRPIRYDDWIQRHVPDSKELQVQRSTVFDVQPLFSVVVPLYKTPEKYLRKLVESVQVQTYANWELCLSDGSGCSSPIENILKEFEKEDRRIRVVRHEISLRISENTNAAIQIASGDFIVFADHDDELAPNALFECVKAINEKLDTDILYSDEDKIAADKNKFFEPHMKPDFNLDLLRTVNYICHLFVVKRELLQTVGMLRSEYDGAQDYDFILRCVEASDKILHIPKVLYHWRSHEDSTAEKPESKGYAFEAGQRAIQAHYERLGIQADVELGEFPGLYRTRYRRPYDPLISILIPNKDHIEDLERCIHAIDTKSTYHNYEYIIVENNSEKEETFQYYKELEMNHPKARVVYWEGSFNYSAINNYGAGYAKGEYLLLLNNDTEIINSDCLEELLGYCMRPDVGVVGGRLYYEDDTIQHAGVVVGFGGIAGHCFVQQKRSSTGYCHRIICAQDYSAVTAACMLVDKKVFDKVGGLSEELAVAFNDIDFCLRVRKAGFLIVYNPYAELYHYESKSRGLDNTPEKTARFNQEIETFAKCWPEILQNGDPYYSPNLTLDSQDFSLRRN